MKKREYHAIGLALALCVAMACGGVPAVAQGVSDAEMDAFLVRESVALTERMGRLATSPVYIAAVGLFSYREYSMCLMDSTFIRPAMPRS